MARREEILVRLTLSDQVTRQLRPLRRALEQTTRALDRQRRAGRSTYTPATRGARTYRAELARVNRQLVQITSALVGVRGASGAAFSALRTGPFAAGAGLGLAVQQFASLEASLTRAGGANESFRRNIDQTRATVRALALETGRAETELGESLFVLAESAFEADEALNVLATGSRVAETRQVPLRQAIRAVGAAIRAYSVDARDAAAVELVGDTLLAGASAGALRIGELENNFGRLISSAKTVNLSLGTTVGLVARLGSDGLTTAQSVTRLARFLEDLPKFAEELAGQKGREALADALGLDTLRRDIEREGQLGFITFLRRIDAEIQRIGGTNRANLETQIFGNLRTRQGGRGLLDDLERTAQAVDDANNAAGRLRSEFEAIQQTTENRVKRSIQGLRALLIDVGEILATSVVNEGAGGLASVFDDMRSGLAEAQPEILEFIGRASGGAGAVLEAFRQLADRDGVPAVFAVIAESAGNLLVGGLRATVPLVFRVGLAIGSGLAEGVTSALYDKLDSEVFENLLRFVDRDLATQLRSVRVARNQVQQITSGVAAGGFRLDQRTGLSPVLGEVEESLRAQGADPQQEAVFARALRERVGRIQAQLLTAVQAIDDNEVRFELQQRITNAIDLEDLRGVAERAIDSLGGRQNAEKIADAIISDEDARQASRKLKASLEAILADTGQPFKELTDQFGIDPNAAGASRALLNQLNSLSEERRKEFDLQVKALEVEQERVATDEQKLVIAKELLRAQLRGRIEAEKAARATKTLVEQVQGRQAGQIGGDAGGALEQGQTSRDVTRAVDALEASYNALNEARRRYTRDARGVEELQREGIITAAAAQSQVDALTSAYREQVLAFEQNVASTTFNAERFPEAAEKVAKLTEAIGRLKDELQEPGTPEQQALLRQIRALRAEADTFDAGLSLRSIQERVLESQVDRGVAPFEDLRAAQRQNALAVIDEVDVILEKLSALDATNPVVEDLRVRLQAIKEEALATPGVGDRNILALIRNEALRTIEQLGSFPELAQNLAGQIPNAFDGLFDVFVTGQKTFEEFARSFLTNIARMIAQTLLFRAIGSAFGLGFSGGGEVPGGGALQIFNLGGEVLDPWRLPGVQHRSWGGPIFGPGGGRVPGAPTPGRDSVRAALEPGEIVIRRPVAQIPSVRRFLLGLNYGRIPPSEIPTSTGAIRAGVNASVQRFNDGGEVRPFPGGGGGIQPAVIVPDTNGAEAMVTKGITALKRAMANNKSEFRALLGIDS